MSEAQWYVVHTYSGYENKVKVDIEKTIENRGLQDQILEVSVPLEEVIVRCTEHQRCDRIRRTGIQAGAAFRRRDDEPWL